MLSFQADVRTLPKRGIRDPAGVTIERHLGAAVGDHTVTKVTIGKLIRLEVNAESLEAATAQIQRLCQVMLVNDVIERYELDVREIDK